MRTRLAQSSSMRGARGAPYGVAQGRGTAHPPRVSGTSSAVLLRRLVSRLRRTASPLALLQRQQVEQKAREVDQVLFHGLARGLGVAGLDGGEGLFVEVVEP